MSSHHHYIISSSWAFLGRSTLHFQFISTPQKETLCRVRQFVITQPYATLPHFLFARKRLILLLFWLRLLLHFLHCSGIATAFASSPSAALSRSQFSGFVDARDCETICNAYCVRTAPRWNCVLLLLIDFLACSNSSTATVRFYFLEDTLFEQMKSG
jgi:hypothetical protein